MKKLFLLLATSLCLTRFAIADTSYLLLQGPFGDLGAVETFQWQVNYTHGTLTTGQDLLNVVFGTPVDTGTLYQSTYEIFSAGNNVQGAHYIDFGSGGSSLFAISFTMNSITKEQSAAWDPSWNYYVAGGAGGNHGGSYSSDSWTYSDDGITTRTLSDGSFDAWSFGENFPADPIMNGTTTYAPTTGNFSSAVVINVVPEPGSVAFLAAGGLLLVRRRRR
jgi:hypothetical protein